MQCSHRLGVRLRVLQYQRAHFLHHTRLGVSRFPSQNHVLVHKSPNGARCFGVSSIPTVLLPPVVFGGLLITLWTYKCLMMIIFQNKIIYMPSMPPFSRSEKVEEYQNECKPVIWTEHSIKSGDGTKLRLLEGSVPEQENTDMAQKHIVVLYFQGNASSLPPRLPYLSNILKLLRQQETSVKYSIIALSYRGFWQSSGRPNQPGIELDAQATLRWLSDRYVDSENVKFAIWGQSIGAGVATTSLATWLDLQGVEGHAKRICISGLLLETPFTSLKAMLIELYPQKFLPYRYLWPFLKSTWDSEAAFVKIGGVLTDVLKAHDSRQRSEISRLRVLLLEAGEDELVPKGDAARLLRICNRYNSIEAEHRTVTAALHTNVMMKSEGKKEIVKFLTSLKR